MPKGRRRQQAAADAWYEPKGRKPNDSTRPAEPSSSWPGRYQAGLRVGSEPRPKREAALLPPGHSRTSWTRTEREARSGPERCRYYDPHLSLLSPHSYHQHLCVLVRRPAVPELDHARNRLAYRPTARFGTLASILAGQVPLTVPTRGHCGVTATVHITNSGRPLSLTIGVPAPPTSGI
jgi:hypothetical protein